MPPPMSAVWAHFSRTSVVYSGFTMYAACNYCAPNGVDPVSAASLEQLQGPARNARARELQCMPGKTSEMVRHLRLNCFNAPPVVRTWAEQQESAKSEKRNADSADGRPPGGTAGSAKKSKKSKARLVEGLVLVDAELIGCASYVDGAFSNDGAGTDFQVRNPANNTVVRVIAEASRLDLNRALESAARAVDMWGNVSAKDRSVVLRTWHDLVLENKKDLARIICLENGKPLAEAVDEVESAASYIDWYCLAAQKSEGSSANELHPGSLGVVTREPIGICLAITPWNFPCAMLVRKVAPALAAGCSVIAKPSELTPLSALALAVLASRAGVPAGAFNVLATSSADHVARVLLSSADVRLLSFTGSSRVGKRLSALASETLVRTCMELSGLAPFIVFDDCDVMAAVDGLMKNKFRLSGQSCISTNRVFVQDGEVYNKFLNILHRRMTAELRVGNGMDPEINVGPLINMQSVARAASQVDDAIAKGARLLHGGKDVRGLRMQQTSLLGETFFPPTLITEVTDDMSIACTETLAPVVAVLRFTSETEVVRRANACRAGLAAYVYTKGVGRAMRVSRALKYGMVGMNTTAISDCRTPFGGMKESGSGREGGCAGLEPYTEVKYTMLSFPPTPDT